MQLRHVKTLAPASPGMHKVTAMCWSPNNKRFAVVTVDRIVVLYDENGEKRDKFSTKPADKGPKNYLVRGMAFSPESTKLAIAQSDNIVFIYKLGLEWGDKKSICNKFSNQSSAVTSLAWPTKEPNKLCFGLADGKVKLGQLKNNKFATCYTTDSYTVSMCRSPDGHGFLSGHIDGSIHNFVFDEHSGAPSHRVICTHSSPPYALDWGESIVAAGNDARVTFYDPSNGMEVRTFDYSNDDSVKEFTVAAFNPSGETVTLGNFNKFFSYNFNARAEEWREGEKKDIPNMYSVTSLAWKNDGSKLTVGTLCGAVDSYDACVKRMTYKGKFEFTYVSLSQVIVKRMAGPSAGHRIVLKSHFNCEITKINVFQDRYLIAVTPETLLMGDLVSCKLSEVPWSGSGSEKYIFENPACCMVFNAGELSLIEYGHNEILGSCRTEHMKPSVLSVRINERPPVKVSAESKQDGVEGENKKIAYLLDIHTIRVLDLASGIGIATINHDARVDWLELNGRGNLLLFRDKRRQLHLYDIVSQNRSTLLNYCNYVQWVPNSDVVVAQNRNNLCVWYNISAPDKVTMYQIKGDVEEIERSGGKTEVIVDEGINTASYMLDEQLIAFGTAMDDLDFERAMDILDGLELTTETEAMWNQLAKRASEERQLHAAERCFAALGDVSKARYLRRVNKIADGVTANTGSDGMQHFKVRASLALLEANFAQAERIYVEQGQGEEAIEMYQMMHRWKDAIKVAQQTGNGDADQMKADYFEYLKDSGQEEAAARLKEEEGDYITAINLYLKGGFPAKAARVVNTKRVSGGGQQLLERIASEMIRAGMYDKAGDFYERMDNVERAMELYIKGNAYRSAVELARRCFPAQVVRLEADWGDYLVSQKQVDAAINHYIEAGEHEKAIRAALDSRQWSKAAQLVEDTLRGDVCKPYYSRIAAHYREAQRYDLAEKYYIQAGKASDAVDMYTRANKWELAHKIATRYMNENEATMLYINQASDLERVSKFKEAERLYLAVNEPDLAINMYKKARKYDQMVRLVKTYRKELLKETHLHLAQQLEMEGNLREAEKHYCEAQEWQSAVNMYRANDNWDEAIRVAKVHGGLSASKRVAYAWAMHLSGEQGAKLLTKLGLIEQAIDYSVETGDFEHAFGLARNSLKSKLPEVHLKHALYLEDEERFTEAEAEFMKAGKPREAIDMYIHQQDWVQAGRVSEQYDPSAMPDVFVAQARVAIERKDFTRGETLFINAKKPELALKAYKEAGRWQDALRVAKRHLPHKLSEVNDDYSRATSGGGSSGTSGGISSSPSGRSDGGRHSAGRDANSDDLLQAARNWEESGDWNRAIDSYLSISEHHVKNLSALEEIWEKAVKISSHHERSRVHDVTREVAGRLNTLKRYEGAGDLFRDVEMFRESVNAYVAGACWKKASQLVEHDAPQFRQLVENARENHMADTGDAHGLVRSGNVVAGLDILARKGDWDKVFDLCESQAPERGAFYATQYASQLVQDGKNNEAIHVLGRFGGDPEDINFTLYKSIVKEFFGRTQKKLSSSASGNDTASLIADLRKLLYGLVQAIKGESGAGAKYNESKGSSGSNAGALKYFERALLVAHYMGMQNEFKLSNHGAEAAKVAVSLLRFCGIIPADRAFYEAGAACKEQNMLSMAFVFFNHYLDLSEAIEEGDATMIDNSDFVGTDIPAPFDYALPKVQYLDEDKREDVRDWVLQISMNQQVDQSLDTNSCGKCGESFYVACLTCPNCKTQSDACILTGYPITSNSSKVSCSVCNNVANKSAWNTAVSSKGVCRWCNASQKPVY
jgi:intraflagellar transport protein 172